MRLWAEERKTGTIELLLTLPERHQLTSAERAQLSAAESQGGGAQNADDISALRAKSLLGQYSSSHWAEPNILAHVRFNERTDANGNRVLAGLGILALLGYLFYLNWKLTLIVLLLFPGLIWIMRVFSRRLYRLTQASQQATHGQHGTYPQQVRDGVAVTCLLHQPVQLLRARHAQQQLRRQPRASQPGAHSTRVRTARLESL